MYKKLLMNWPPGLGGRTWGIAVNWWRKLRSALAPRGRLQALLVGLQQRRRHTLPGDHSYTFQARDYPGSRIRHYLVHAPPAGLIRKPRPLLMVLHGCRQDNRSIEKISDFNRLADQHGFLVVYPFITSYRGIRFENCWGWWFDREIHAGAGEVEDLWQIIEEVSLAYAVDRRRIHVAGLSSGAAMSVAMLVAHADRIASGASVAGLPYGERADAVRHAYNRTPRNRPVKAIVSTMKRELGNRRCPALQIIHSHHDETVDIQSAVTLRDSWAECLGVDGETPRYRRRGRDGGTDWVHSRYAESGREPALETLFLNGPGHGWYGGVPGEYSYPDGPDISSEIWAFFKTHPLEK